ncbi:putative methyltransferase PMT21 [Cocos nucifera]|uniref:Putative methyltransferase PMT21 n=1 Tax=Cocos nucifera TaxID=13894 RepID=A0A8K0IGC7_COCNU|nr:putative methyltransferase PMT21 [Cocos nucifera]
MMLTKILRKDVLVLMDGQLASELMNVFILPVDRMLQKNILVENALDARSISIIEMMHLLLFVREALAEYDRDKASFKEKLKIAKEGLKSEVANGAIFAYHLGFKECLGKVKESFPEVEVSHIVPGVKEPIDGEDNGGKVAPSEVTTLLDVVTAETTITIIIETPSPN